MMYTMMILVFFLLLVLLFHLINEAEQAATFTVMCLLLRGETLTLDDCSVFVMDISQEFHRDMNLCMSALTHTQVLNTYTCR